MNAILMKRMQQRKRNKKGFTLVEVIVVLVILAILAAIAIPSLTGYIDKANQRAVESQARSVTVAIQAAITDAYGQGHTITAAFTDGTGGTGDTLVYAGGPTLASEVNKLTGEDLVKTGTETGTGTSNLTAVIADPTSGQLLSYEIEINKKKVKFEDGGYTPIP